MHRAVPVHHALTNVTPITPEDDMVYTTETAPEVPAGAQPDRATLRRVVTAGFVGTTVEYYDFFIYGTAAALVFPKLFFPELGSAAGTAASFATFAVAFVARPLGGVVFGHLGDKVGRKATLVLTMVLMGAASVAIGLIPTGATIGVVAPILLIALRFLQGLAIGGEWASAALFVGEYAPRKQRAVYGLAPALGTFVGLMVATTTFLVTGWTMSDATFAASGWRVPFLLSVVLVAIGLVVRLSVADTPVFRQAMKRAEAIEKAMPPFLDMLAHQWKQVLLAGGAVVMWLSFFYLGAVYLQSYGTHALGFTRNEMLTVNMVAIAIGSVAAIIGGLAADRYGRRLVMSVAAVAAVPWAFAIFPLADSQSLPLLLVAVCVTVIVVGLACGPTTALLPEIFHTRYRATATGASFNLGSLVGGAIPPVVAAPILENYGSTALAAMMAAFALISAACVLMLTETRGRSLLDT